MSDNEHNEQYEETNKNLAQEFGIDDQTLEDVLDDMLNTEEDNPLMLTPEQVTQVIDYMDFDVENSTFE